MSGIVALMGSGELAPTMVGVHRRLLDGAPGPAVMLDAPFAFQENRAELAERARSYFDVSLRTSLEVLADDDDPVRRAEQDARLAEAGYVFSGPGSPTYALRRWRETAVPGLLADVVRRGGRLAFASAAALTLGRWTIPVYEIYKVGEPVRWEDGLDVLGALGLPGVVVPHFDNAEGGTHDTRFCWMGERRFRRLLEALPEGTRVIGIDEHTAIVLDLGTQEAEIVGKGGVTIVDAPGPPTSWRRLEPGVVELSAVVAPTTPTEGRTADETDAEAAGAPVTAGPGVATAVGGEVGRDQTAPPNVEDPEAIGRALLELGDALPGEAAARHRLLVGRLVAAARSHGPREEIAAPLVESVLAARSAARAAGRWEVADALRDALTAVGVEIHDTADGTTWSWPETS